MSSDPLPARLRPSGYKPRPIDTTRVTLTPEILELTETLARSTHDNWARRRLAEGWRYGPHRDDAHHEHPGLVPYESLSESEKDYDRSTALETLKAILALGYKIEKGAPDMRSARPARQTNSASKNGAPIGSAVAAPSSPAHRTNSASENGAGVVRRRRGPGNGSESGAQDQDLISPVLRRPSRVTARQKTVENKFLTFSKRWQEETYGNSCIDELIGHPDYQGIIDLGVDVVPLLLRELKDHPFRWLYALKQITGEDPSEGVEEVDAIASAWIRWGVEKGFL